MTSIPIDELISGEEYTLTHLGGCEEMKTVLVRRFVRLDDGLPQYPLFIDPHMGLVNFMEGWVFTRKPFWERYA